MRKEICVSHAWRAARLDISSLTILRPSFRKWASRGIQFSCGAASRSQNNRLNQFVSNTLRKEGEGAVLLSQRYREPVLAKYPLIIAAHLGPLVASAWAMRTTCSLASGRNAVRS